MKVNFLLLLVLGFLTVSCHTVRQVTVKKEIPSLTENKLLHQIDLNQLKYNTLFAKRIDISLSNDKGSNSFKASLKIQRDSFIQISLTAPLGIEVARILLTRDSIKFADIYHKKYFFGDYDYFYDKYESKLTYNCIQNILTNTFFDFIVCSGEAVKNKRYKLDKCDSGYELSTLEEKALGRKIKKLYKKRRKNKDFILILQKIIIDPQNFRPLSVSIEDVEEDIGVSVNYRGFNNYNGKIFPEKIAFALFSEHNKTTLELKFLKLEFDVPVDANFRISSKYKKIE